MSTYNQKQLRIVQLLKEKQDVLQAPVPEGVDEYTAACDEEATLYYIDKEIMELRRSTSA